MGRRHWPDDADDLVEILEAKIVNMNLALKAAEQKVATMQAVVDAAKRWKDCYFGRKRLGDNYDGEDDLYAAIKEVK